MVTAHTDLVFDPQAQLTVIPPNDRRRGVSFAQWDEDAPTLRRLVLSHTTHARHIRKASEDADCDAVLPILLALVPRPDNDYDPRAIAVTAPPSHGGDVLERHLGYLYSQWLDGLGPLIRDLTEHSPVPVGCHGYIELDEVDRDWPHDDESWDISDGDPLSPTEEEKLGYTIGSVRLLLPEPNALKPLVARYIAERRSASAACPESDGSRVETQLRQAQVNRFAHLLSEAHAARQRTGVWGRETDRSRAQDALDSQAHAQNAEWAIWRGRPHGRRGLTALPRAGSGADRIVLLDDGQAAMGEWHLPDGPLTLVDERTRPEALAALTARGVLTSPRPELDALTAFADATVRVADSVWTIHSVEEDVRPAQLPEIGRYDHDSGVLTVYARPHREPVTVLLERHGVTPRQVTWGRPSRATQNHNEQAREPWARITPFTNDRPPWPGEAASPAGWFPLREDVRSLLPEHLLGHLPVVWRSPDHRGGTDPYLERLNRQSMRHLLGAEHTQRLRPARCRLCGDDTFGTPGGLAYCLMCSSRAMQGVVRDTGVDEPWTEIAVWGLRRLAELEFSGPPAQSQLHRLTVTDPTVADAAMLCRFLIPRPGTAVLPVRHRRPARSWPEWLHVAGLLEDGLRTSRGIVSIAVDGHRCRSMLERHIDDFLHHRSIPHEVEPAYPRHADLNTTGLRADWLLPDGTFVEALGFPNKPAYAAKVARKRRLAGLLGIPLVTVTAEDLHRLPEVFAPWLTAASDSVQPPVG